ncbi:phage BR0599 family protein [Azohydromonas sediminis]|uniref:phage BR0599 family protein n=1 Tax=Azohydromonas sediminis TaxID=2259674 RepID=UPI000E647E57|nr:phage BR0599 family protein [Azohydromonas sediminis]
MTLDARERSTQDGSPVELYEFRRGNTAWRYTSAAQSQLHLGSEYMPLPMRRSSLERSAELGRSGLRVSMPRDAQVAAAFISAPPADVTLLTIYRRHRDDTETLAVWIGRVLNAEWRGSEVELNCEPSYTSLQRTGLRRMYQRTCTHVLYGTDCKVSAVAFRVSGSVSEVDGNDISVAAAASFSAGHFAGGYATWQSGLVTEKRMITAHDAEWLTLSAAPAGLFVGAPVMLYPGCDHSLATCATKFANTDNFGGFPFIPTKNPFGSNPIY